MIHHIISWQISDRQLRRVSTLATGGGGGFISRHDNTRKRQLLKSTRNDKALLGR
jgi:hypothetical protein